MGSFLPRLSLPTTYTKNHTAKVGWALGRGYRTDLFWTCHKLVTLFISPPVGKEPVSEITPLCTYSSLVPRLPHSGMRTLKLCRRGEPGIFCHVKNTKDRRQVDATLIVRKIQGSPRDKYSRSRRAWERGYTYRLVWVASLIPRPPLFLFLICVHYNTQKQTAFEAEFRTYTSY